MVWIEGLKITQGSLKTYTKVADSGNRMTSYFCEDCGSTLYRASSGYPGVVAMRAGCMDELDVETVKPRMEMFGRSHVEWLPEIPGVEQNETGLYLNLS
jgi:hypothetical protein